eukprot:101855-Rhodomonas_salina.1
MAALPLFLAALLPFLPIPTPVPASISGRCSDGRGRVPVHACTAAEAMLPLMEAMLPLTAAMLLFMAAVLVFMGGALTCVGVWGAALPHVHAADAAGGQDGLGR